VPFCWIAWGGKMNSQWWEVQILGTLGLEEVLFEALLDCGCQGTVSQLQGDQMQVRSYFPQLTGESVPKETIAQHLQTAAEVAELTIQSISWSAIAEEDWANSWKDYWHPTEIGERLLIYPAWLDLPQPSPAGQPERILLRLDPGVAFGTGTHASTQLCLLLLEEHFSQSTSEEILADIGCGSGILAIAALKLGAQQVYAVDTDPLAISSTAEARDLNNLTAEQLPVLQDSIDAVLPHLKRPVDGFCCNILAPVIISLIPQMQQLTKSGGWGILSGILQTQAEQVSEAFTAQGWTLKQTRQQGDWAALEVIKP
jgi:ribosomal protein L11 methyltransferase